MRQNSDVRLDLGQAGRVIRAGAPMTPAIERGDDDSPIACLESTNPRNLSLYERHGFEIVGQIQAGPSPTLYPMVRETRG